MADGDRAHDCASGDEARSRSGAASDRPATHERRARVAAPHRAFSRPVRPVFSRAGGDGGRSLAGVPGPAVSSRVFRQRRRAQYAPSQAPLLSGIPRIPLHPDLPPRCARVLRSARRMVRAGLGFHRRAVVPLQAYAVDGELRPHVGRGERRVLTAEDRSVPSRARVEASRHGTGRVLAEFRRQQAEARAVPPVLAPLAQAPQRLQQRPMVAVPPPRGGGHLLGLRGGALRSELPRRARGGSTPVRVGNRAAPLLRDDRRGHSIRMPRLAAVRPRLLDSSPARGRALGGGCRTVVTLRQHVDRDVL